MKIILTTILIALSINVVQANETLFSKAKNSVMATLIDPDSAKFGEQKVTNNGTTAVCGVVNAKNRFGGYAGAKVYYVSFKKGKPVEVGFGPDESQVDMAIRTKDLKALDKIKEDIAKMMVYCS